MITIFFQYKKAQLLLHTNKARKANAGSVVDRIIKDGNNNELIFYWIEWKTRPNQFVNEKSERNAETISIKRSAPTYGCFAAG